MELETFIRILRDRFKELEYPEEYIESKISSIREKYSYLSDEDVKKVTTEALLKSILAEAKKENEHDDTDISIKIVTEDKKPVSSSQTSYTEDKPNPVASQKSTPYKDSVGSTRVGSTRVGSTRVGSTRVGSTRVGSTRVGSTRVGSTRVGSTRVGSTRVGSTRVGSTRVGSTRVGSTRVSTSQTQTNRPKSNDESKNTENIQVGAGAKSPSARKISESDLYNPKSKRIFPIMIILLSPTLAVLSLFIAIFAIVALGILSAAIALIIILCVIFTLIGLVLSSSSFAYSVYMFISQNYHTAFTELSVFFFASALICVTLPLLMRLTYKAVPKLLMMISYFCKNICKLIREFFQKFKKGCETL